MKGKTVIEIILFLLTVFQKTLGRSLQTYFLP